MNYELQEKKNFALLVLISVEINILYILVKSYIGSYQNNNLVKQKKKKKKDFFRLASKNKVIFRIEKLPALNFSHDRYFILVI